jgi:alpha-N-arabinofuranosidase
MGHKTAYEYGRLAAETARAMRRLDPEIELIACGSSGRHMPTFGSWEATVLEQCYDQVDYVSMHAYYEEHHGDTDSFLASAVDMDAFIDEVVATADHVKAKLRSPKRLKVSFDEWNVWYQRDWHGEASLEWQQAPRLIEDDYNDIDAVVVGTYLISLLGHADRVGIACQAQLANVIAPIRTEPGGPARKQTIFHPFAHMAGLARGDALRVEPVAHQINTDAYGPVPALTAAASHDPGTGAVVVFAVNRDRTSPLELNLDLRGFQDARLRTHRLLNGELSTRPDQVTVELPPASWNVLEFSTDQHDA